MLKGPLGILNASGRHCRPSPQGLGLLQLNVNARRQKFMLGSPAGVLFTIPKLGCKSKSSGLSSGQNLVFLVGACKLL